jgi:predicted ester cyclase
LPVASVDALRHLPAESGISTAYLSRSRFTGEYRQRTIAVFPDASGSAADGADLTLRDPLRQVEELPGRGAQRGLDRLIGMADPGHTPPEGMTMGIAKDLVERQHDMLRRRDVARVADLYATDGIFSMAGMRINPSDLPAVMQAYLAAFPDVSNEVTGWIESSDGVAVEQVITATHTGTWMTPFGELAATGKQLRWEAVEFVRIHNDHIVSWHSYFDQLPVLMALGAVPGLSAK